MLFIRAMRTTTPTTNSTPVPTCRLEGYAPICAYDEGSCISVCPVPHVMCTYVGLYTRYIPLDRFTLNLIGEASASGHFLMNASMDVLAGATTATHGGGSKTGF